MPEAAIIIVMVYALVFFIDYLPLLRSQKTKEVWLYGCMMFISLILVLLVCFGVDVPSPFLY